MKNYEYEEWLDEKYLSPDYPTDEEMKKTELTIDEIKKEISRIIDDEFWYTNKGLNCYHDWLDTHVYFDDIKNKQEDKEYDIQKFEDDLYSSYFSWMYDTFRKYFCEAKDEDLLAYFNTTNNKGINEYCRYGIHFDDVLQAITPYSEMIDLEQDWWSDVCDEFDANDYLIDKTI